MRIVFDCGSGGPEYDWDGSHVGKGLGGSEECVVYLAQELVKLGHEVEVYNHCMEGGASIWPVAIVEGVTYRESRQPDLPAGVDYVGRSDLRIAWRDYHLLAERRADQQWLWCHDIPEGNHCPSRAEIQAGALDNIDRVVVLNEYHKGLYLKAGVPADKLWVCQIGVNLADFDQTIERIPGKCIYLSHPHRGLEKLREYWPQIRQQVPGATLQACWWQEEFFLEPDEALGILPMKKLGHKDLAAEILSSELLTYPCTFAPEISPASAIKAQVGGAVPVVIPQGGMKDVLGSGHMADRRSFPHAVALALTDDAWRITERHKGIVWARGVYDWAMVARIWLAAAKFKVVPVKPKPEVKEIVAPKLEITMIPKKKAPSATGTKKGK